MALISGFTSGCNLVSALLEYRQKPIKYYVHLYIMTRYMYIAVLMGDNVDLKRPKALTICHLNLSVGCMYYCYEICLYSCLSKCIEQYRLYSHLLFFFPTVSTEHQRDPSWSTSPSYYPVSSCVQLYLSDRPSVYRLFCSSCGLNDVQVLSVIAWYFIIKASCFTYLFLTFFLSTVGNGRLRRPVYKT